MFQTFDRDLFRQSNSAHRHSSIRSCSKADFSFEWARWILTAFLGTSPIFHCSISARCFIKHDPEYLLEQIQTPASLLDYCFKARRCFILIIDHCSIGVAYSKFILMIEKLTGASKAHSLRHWNHTQDWDLTLCDFLFKEVTTSSPI